MLSLYNRTEQELSISTRAQSSYVAYAPPTHPPADLSPSGKWQPHASNNLTEGNSGLLALGTGSAAILEGKPDRDPAFRGYVPRIRDATLQIRRTWAHMYAEWEESQPGRRT